MFERLQASRTTTRSKEKILPDKAQLKSIFTSDTAVANASSILSDLLDKMNSQRDLGQICHSLDLLGVHIIRAALFGNVHQLPRSVYIHTQCELFYSTFHNV